MKTNRSFAAFVLSFITAGFMSGALAETHWSDMLNQPGANFYDIKKEFYREKAAENAQLSKTAAEAQTMVDGEVQNAADALYYRWESYTEPRVYPSGDLSLLNNIALESVPYLGIDGTAATATAKAAASAVMAGNWTSFGSPVPVLLYGGTGRLNTVRFSPFNAAVIYVGSPSGGLWVSTNSGSSWAIVSDRLAVLGAADVVIDPTNQNIMYLATGDKDQTGIAGGTNGIGLLKSTDGGMTWNSTGLTWKVSDNIRSSRVLLNPANTSILLVAASTGGLWRSTDAGATWTRILTATIRDMQFKTNDPTVVFASGGSFYRSSNGGASFTQITSVPSVNRIAIAVTPNDPLTVYALCANSTNFNSFHRSTDGGLTFSQRANSPDIITNQGFYNLAVAASPANRNVVVVGGIYIWRSTDGGATWTQSNQSNYHVDVHDIQFPIGGNGNTVYAATDGGIFRSTDAAVTWTNLSTGLVNAEMYRLGLSQRNSGRVLTGWQDNGTVFYNSGVWSQVMGGDGFECFFDWSDTNYCYASYQNGSIQRSANKGANWTGITPSGQSGPWLTAWTQDPLAAATLYYGASSGSVYKSTNRGGAWTQTGALTGSGTIVRIRVDPSNSNNVCVARAQGLSRSTNGGTSWTSIAAGLPLSSASLADIDIDNANGNNLWVCFSGFSAGNKVFRSTNAGTSWTNISDSLPNLPANCLIFQKSSNGAVYAGMDVGVFYRDNALNAWIPFFNGLPNCEVRELEIYYGASASAHRLRAACWGRGLWETPLYSPTKIDARETPAARVAGFSVKAEKGYRTLSIRFTAIRNSRYVVEISNPQGKIMRREDLGVRSGPYAGKIDVGTRGSNGVYVAVLKTGGTSVARSIFLLKR